MSTVDPTSPTASADDVLHEVSDGVVTRLMAESSRRPDLAEGVASFAERRPPRFGPLDRSAVPPTTLLPR